MDEKGKLAFWIKLMKLGALTGCHQMYERSFVFRKYQFPVCTRCTGLFFGNLIGLAFSFLLLRFSIWYHLSFALLFTIILAIDGFGQKLGKWTSTNRRRLITGLLCGFFMAALLVKAVVLLIWVILCINAD